MLHNWPGYSGWIKMQLQQSPEKQLQSSEVEKKWLLWYTYNKDNYRRKPTDLRNIISLSKPN